LTPSFSYDSAPPSTHTLSLHDALPISISTSLVASVVGFMICRALLGLGESGNFPAAIKATTEWFPSEERALATGLAEGKLPDSRSEEHTSELQSRENLVCRLLLEKKKK